jgi:hypothetical protein
MGRAVGPAAVCAVVVATASLLGTFWLLPSLQRFFFVWDHNFGPAVSYACGRPFADVAHPPADLVDFLNRRRPDFDCGHLPSDAQFVPINAYANGIPYFLRGLGLYWRWRGVAWPRLAPLFATLFAVSNVLVFLLFRQFLGNAWALGTALIYSYSPGNYLAATYYEHFAKVPIFLAILLVIVSLARTSTVAAARLFVLAAIAGVLLGVGFGIRADLWLLIAPSVAAIVWCCGTDRRPPLPHRVGACIVLLATAIVIALPATMTGGRSYFWLQLVEGLSSDFDADLSIRPAVYEWVPTYSDELGASWMQAHATDDGSPDALEWQGQERAGRTAYLRVMRYFPADFLTRPLAAAIKVVVDSLRTQPASAARFSSAAPNFFTRSAPFWRALSRISVWPVFLLPAGLLVLAQRHPRQALFLFLVVVYLGGSTAIAFLPRHRWHLYFIGFLTIATAAKFVVDRLRARSAPRVNPSALTGAAAVAAAAAILVAASRIYQDRSVAALVERTLAAPRQPIRIDWRESRAGLLEGVAAGLFSERRDDGGDPPHVERAEYVVATFARDGCVGAPSVRIRYRASQPSYDHSLAVPFDFGSGRSFTYVFPAYETRFGSGYGVFEGFDVPSRACLVSAERVQNRSALPLLITWHLPERWRDRPRHQTIVFPPDGP